MYHTLTPSISFIWKSNRDLSKTSSIHSSGGEGSGPVHTKPPFQEKKYIPLFACSSHGNIRKVRFEKFCKPAKYPCLPSPLLTNDAEPKDPELNLPTVVNSSSWHACSEPAKALATGSPRLAIILFDNHLVSFFLAMILSNSFSVLVTGSTLPHRILPFQTIVGR